MERVTAKPTFTATHCRNSLRSVRPTLRSRRGRRFRRGELVVKRVARRSLKCEALPELVALGPAYGARSPAGLSLNGWQGAAINVMHCRNSLRSVRPTVLGRLPESTDLVSPKRSYNTKLLTLAFDLGEMSRMLKEELWRYRLNEFDLQVYRSLLPKKHRLLDALELID